ncbi:MAG TPA: hypothetical protein PKI14_12625 [Fervidobacterium sp.]|jgi:hypothetical protein|nr:hypothetical protein [Bacillota bacterium]HUM43784.1 hypothetical protein [Fervidobacterium sp.]
MAKYCKDCKNCATFDVFKGNCEALGKRVILDTPMDDCSDYQQKEKCGFCKYYAMKPKEEFLGVCRKDSDVPDVDVYAELVACNDFVPSA